MNERIPSLSKRMQLVADMVTKGSKVADIGCDHGYVSIYLYKKNIASKCIAADINKDPLLSAKENIRLYGASDGIETRLSNGLKEIRPKEADSIIIAGMGGKTITGILNSGIETADAAKELILEPQSEIAEVRSFLMTNGYRIIMERSVTEENKFYPVIKAVKGENEKLTLAELEYGPCLLRDKDELTLNYINKRMDEITSLKEKLLKIDSKEAKRRVDELKKEEEIAKGALRYYE